MAGRELGVRAVLSGRMMLRGDDLVVSVELIDVERQAQLWGGRFNRKMADLISLQEELATEISERLRLQLTGDERRKLRKRPTQNDEAYRLVLMAQHYLAGSSGEAMRKGAALCQQAIEIDPTYAAAHARLSMAYSFMRFCEYTEPADVVPGSDGREKSAGFRRHPCRFAHQHGLESSVSKLGPSGRRTGGGACTRAEPRFQPTDGFCWIWFDSVRTAPTRPLPPENERSNWRRFTTWRHSA